MTYESDRKPRSRTRDTEHGMNPDFLFSCPSSRRSSNALYAPKTVIFAT